MTPHPYADILRAIADGKEIQVLRAGTWRDTHPESVFNAAQLPTNQRLNPEDYRVKSERIKKYFAYLPKIRQWLEINSNEINPKEGEEGYLWTIEMEVAAEYPEAPTKHFHVKLC